SNPATLQSRPAGAVGPRFSGSGLWRAAGAAGGHAADYRRALPGLRGQHHRSSMQADQAAHQGKAQADAALPAGAHANEFVEEPGLVRGRAPDAGIGDREFDHAAEALRGDRDPAIGRREFYGVADQVEKRLFQAPLIGDQGAPLAGALEGQADPAAA